MLLLHLHYNNWEARGRTPECPKMSGHFSLASAVKIFLLCHGEPCTARQERVGLQHGAVPGGVGASGLGWLHAGMGWEAASGSGGGGWLASDWVAGGCQGTGGDGGILGQQETLNPPCQRWAVVLVPRQGRRLSAGARLLRNVLARLARGTLRKQGCAEQRSEGGGLLGQQSRL